MTEAQAERAKALADAEAALKREAGARAAREAAQFEAAELARREAAQARGVAQRTAVLAVVAGFAGLYSVRQKAEAVTADGSRLVTGSWDDTARVWELFPSRQTLIEQAKSVAPRCLTTAQHKLYYLSETPPRWCIAMEKWPYGPATLAAQAATTVNRRPSVTRVLPRGGMLPRHRQLSAIGSSIVTSSRGWFCRRACGRGGVPITRCAVHGPGPPVRRGRRWRRRGGD